MTDRRCRPRESGDRYAHPAARVALWHQGDKPVRSLDLGEDVNDMVALLDPAATVRPSARARCLPRCAPSALIQSKLWVADRCRPSIL